MQTSTPFADIQNRAEQIDLWLKENCPECKHEQGHLVENTPERIYWHYGYMVALRDVLRLLKTN